LAEDGSSGFNRDPSFADAARTRYRDQAMLVKGSDKFRDIAIPAHKRRSPRRQIIGRRDFAAVVPSARLPRSRCRCGLLECATLFSRELERAAQLVHRWMVWRSADAALESANRFGADARLARQILLSEA